jgi:hypothetical protein
VYYLDIVDRLSVQISAGSEQLEGNQDEQEVNQDRPHVAG